MKKILITLLAITTIALYSCDDTEKGFLETDRLTYTTDSLVIYLEANPTDSVPYQSESVQSVIGTFPITYELGTVRDSTGAIVPETISSQIHVVLKGIFEIARNHTIPVGRYSLDLRVSNIHESVLIPNIFTLIVGKTNY